MTTYVQASIEELEFLVNLRIKEMELFSEVPVSIDTAKNIRNFYYKKMKENECITILGYDNELLVTTGTIYFYEAMPSNANPSGITGYVTNIWTHDKYCRQGLASNIMKQLVAIAKDRCGIVCLNSSIEGKELYKGLGFKENDRNMVYTWKN